ncbi:MULTISPECIES: hypothetical protein [unclassified Rhizobium]|uniref:hypothetical protein n=1 Tax=unclassified Rhizobium TaxID=2613769 RepID=UPI0009E6FE43|nr:MULTISPECIES: hypothetical protein [unclassified Rhizobium]
MQKQVVEFNGEAVGALVPEGERFRFIAVKFNVWALDGRAFSAPLEARRAVIALLSREPGQTMPSASFWVPGEDDPSESQFKWNETSTVPPAAV